MALEDFVPDTEDDELDDEPRPPSTRADCRQGPRPCPWVSCRYHLLLDMTQAGSLRLPGGRSLPIWASRGRAQQWARRAVDRLATMEESCALDLAERGGMVLDDIADVLGLTRERVRQLEAQALKHAAPALADPVGVVFSATCSNGRRR